MEAHQKTQAILQGREVLGMAVEDHRVTGAKEVELDLLGGMEYQDPWDLLVLEDFQEEMNYLPLGAILLPLDWECPLCLMLI